MPKIKQSAKRELENPGDISISIAPAAPKKSKSQPQPAAPNNTKTRSATKQAKAGNADADTNSQGSDANPTDAGMTKPRPRPKVKETLVADPAPKPVEADNSPVPPPTKVKKSNPPQKLTTTITTSQSQDETTLAPPKAKAKKTNPPKELAIAAEPDSVSEPNEAAQLLLPSKKSTQAKKPSEIAEKVNKQTTAKQNAKEVQAAKKAKKAEAAVIVETPEDTAAFLAKVKGKQPEKTSPAVTSPKRKKSTVDRTKALEQLVSAHVPSPSPSLVSGVSAVTGASTRTSSIAPDDSVSQINAPRTQKTAKSSLLVPGSHPSSRNVSPAAPPHLDLPSSAPESVVTGDDFDDFEETVNASTVDVNSLLSGIPKPWNLGPAEMPPELPAPFHTAKLSAEAEQRIAQARKDKTKAPWAAIGNFWKQDHAHLKLNLKHMEDLILTVYGFPDDALRWVFACISNYRASMELKRSYRITPESEHCRLLYSRISQTRGKLVAATMSDGIRNHYPGLHWDPDAEDPVALAQEIQERVEEMISSSSFLAPATKPGLYYQNKWFAHILKLAYWTGTSSKGFVPRHAPHFGGISYALLALVVTATERMIAVVAGGLNAAATNHRNANNAFSHDSYGHRFESHMLTLAQLHLSPAGEHLTKYLTRLYNELRGARPVSTITQGPTPKLAIPLSAFNNYGAEPEPRVSSNTRSPASTASSHSRTLDVLPGIDLGQLLKSRLSNEQKVKILQAIYEQTDENPPESNNNPHSRSSRQYQGLLTEVNDDSDDSEVQARRAGALARPVSEVQAQDSDEEMVEHTSDGEGEGKIEVETSSEGEVEAGAEDDGMAVLEGGEGGDTGDAETNADDPSDDDCAPSKPRELKFFDANGNLAPYDTDDDDASDGEGTSGAVVTEADGDRSMKTVADSDEDA